MTATTMTERRRWSLGFRSRVLGLTAVLLIGATSLGLVLQRAVLLGGLSSEVDQSLEQEREEIVRLSTGRDPETGEPFGADVRAIFDTFLRRNVPGEGEVYVTLVDGAPYRTTFAPGGVRLDRDAGLVGRWAELEAGEWGTLETAAGPVRYLAVPLVVDGTTNGVFVVANFEQQERDEVENFIRTEAVVSGLVLLIALSAAWLLAGRLLRPVRDVTDTAQSITETDLSRRIPVDTNDEVGRLAATFNAMLDRLDTAFATQRRFVADAGHELRTPITVVRGHLELIGDDPVDRAETIALVTDELDRMARIVNDLLLLAKAEQTDFVSLEPVEVSELTAEVVMKARALGDRTWRLDRTGEGEVLLDPQRMSQALLNLARNAAEHTTSCEEISIGSTVDDQCVTFWLSDRGPGIPQEDRPRIFERFDRGSTPDPRREGAGLGLSIVRAIVDAHHGSVEVSDTPGGGATFTISLPCHRRIAARPNRTNIVEERTTA